MGFTVHYDRDDPREWSRAADDFAEYVGPKRVALIIEAFRDGTIPNLETFQAAANFAGVTGFPVEAFAARHGVY